MDYELYYQFISIDGHGALKVGIAEYHDNVWFNSTNEDGSARSVAEQMEVLLSQTNRTSAASPFAETRF